MACQQPDGSWRVVQNIPGLPTQEYLVPRPPATNAAAEAPASRDANPQPAPNPPPCSNYTVPVTVGGRQEEAAVEACTQADGSWRITQNTPGLPPQVYVIPPPPSSPYPYPYPYDYANPEFIPYWADAPWFFGLAPSIVVVQRFHHFHGFGHGFAHGFGHGFAHGFGHGFAGGRAGGGQSHR